MTLDLIFRDLMNNIQALLLVDATALFQNWFTTHESELKPQNDCLGKKNLTAKYNKKEKKLKNHTKSGLKKIYNFGAGFWKVKKKTQSSKNKWTEKQQKSRHMSGLMRVTGDAERGHQQLETLVCANLLSVSEALELSEHTLVQSRHAHRLHTTDGNRQAQPEVSHNTALPAETPEDTWRFCKDRSRNTSDGFLTQRRRPQWSWSIWTDLWTSPASQPVKESWYNDDKWVACLTRPKHAGWSASSYNLHGISD